MMAPELIHSMSSLTLFQVWLCLIRVTFVSHCVGLLPEPKDRGRHILDRKPSPFRCQFWHSPELLHCIFN